MGNADEHDGSEWIGVDEAAERLSVKRETVYAYVSRGRLTSRPAPGRRGSLLDAAEVERLITMTARRRQATAPIIESTITTVVDGAVHYRGHDASELALSLPFEDVAELLWASVPTGPDPWSVSSELSAFGEMVVRELPDGAFPIDQLKASVGYLGAIEPMVDDATPEVMVASARRILMSTVSSLPMRSEPARTDRREGTSPFAALLWSRLCERPPSHERLVALSAAMAVSADHDLPASTYVVRVAANAGVDAAGLIRLGMDVGKGPVKGATSLAIETFFAALQSPEAVEKALMKRLRQGEPLPGFGHVLHPSGDPRAKLVLRLLRDFGAGTERMATVNEVIRAMQRRGLPPANLGFALAALTYVTEMCAGAAEAVFVLGRSAGWIAHAIEARALPPQERQQSVRMPNVGRRAGT